MVGAVIGFALTLAESDRVNLWMTGDTVLHRPLRRLAETICVDVLLMHLGRVRFRLTGGLTYTMDSRDAVELIELVRPRVAVPVHAEGWSHFSEPETAARTALTVSSTTGVVQWPEPGVPIFLSGD